MRYILLVILNLPVVAMAVLNVITQHKMGTISSRRFRQQIIFWIILLLVITLSFPIYNLVVGRPVFDSASLSGFDIAEITAIVFLIYAANNLRRKLEQAERRLRDLHQDEIL